MSRRISHLRSLCAVGLLAAGWIGAPASAQPGDGFAPLPTVMVDEIFAPISVRDAIRRGRDEGRVTIVVTALARPPRGREAWWANQTLRDWLLREAIVVWAQPRNEDLLVWVRGADRGSLYVFAGIDLFIDGTHVVGAGGDYPTGDAPRLTSDFSPALTDTAPIQLDGAPAPSAEWVLSVLDHQRELAMVRSPVFAHRARERRAAAPAARVDPPTSGADQPPAPQPQRGPVYASVSGSIPAIMDLEREPTARWRAVTQRAAEAAAAARAGKAGEAIALWTWLWERSAEIDPAATFVAELALVALLETSEQTELARARLVSLVEANPGDAELVASRSPRPFGAPSDAALALLLSTAGSPASLDAAQSLSKEDLAVWRVATPRAVASMAIEPLRRLVMPGERRSALALDERAASVMLADLRDAQRPAIIPPQQWEQLQSVRRAQIIALHARAAYLCTRAGGRMDIDAGHAFRRLMGTVTSWPDVDRAAAARAIGLAFILAERRPPALLDDLQLALDRAGNLDPSRPTQALIDALVALPEAGDRSK